ncbi:hypothetical protein B0H14DRAFT_2580714 [Mycena olivaceomarginata]|nr:hypothetical protein B0H14DRAFT_2600661 [Mycena olivaceomarginata]KAJ7852773.1 hypothetical protein B0H14DRAFT_2580714 [Mycena olivaceomarginata]
MQFNVLAFLAALFTVAAAKTDCLTILQGAACPVGYRVCGPVRIDQTKCCPYGKKWIIGSASSHDVIGMAEIGHAGMFGITIMVPKQKKATANASFQERPL